MSTRAFCLAAAALLATAACAPDPVHEQRVTALGPEPATGPSQFHRAGQPCGTCHGDDGPASSAFSVAGTIFGGASTLAGVAAARVDLVDALGTHPPRPIYTNCVGNFWVRASEWQPRFPVRVEVSKGEVARAMKAPIGRSASCATCHETSGAHPFEKPGPIVLDDDASSDVQRLPGGASCPVDPRLLGAP